MNSYAIYIIKYYLKSNNFDDNYLKFLTEQLNDEYLLLFSSLLNKGNKQLSFDILIILINITFTQQGELLFGKEENVINNISVFLGNNKTDNVLLGYGFLLIKHITTHNSLVKHILYKYKIIEFINDIYQMHILDSFLMDNLISCLGRFINLRFEKNKNFLGSIKIIKSQLNKNTEIFLLIKYIKILYNLAVYDDQTILKQMFDEDIYKNLLELFPFDDDYFININKNMKFNYINNDINIDNKEYYKEKLRDLRILILKTIGRILGVKEKKYIQKIIDFGFYQFLNQLLKLTDIKIIKYAFYCIGSICKGTFGQIKNLYDNNTISLAYIVAKKVYENIKNNKLNKELLEEYFKALKEIIFCFCLLILNSLNEKLIPFINSDNYFIISLLKEGLKLFEDNTKNETLIITIFDAFSHLLKLPNNNFPLFLEQNGFKEILNKLLINSKEEIVDKAQKFYDEYFDDDIDDNTDKININDIIEENESDN